MSEQGQGAGAAMEQMEAGAEHPFWVILDPLEHFISGHATLAEAEAEARRLNQWAQAQGRSPHYTTKLRPQIEE